MDAIVDKARAVVEGEIDFEGQRFVEIISNVLLSTAGFLAFVVGFATQNIQYTLWILLGGTALTFVVCVPAWPFYNQDPVRWLPAKKSSGASGYDITVDGKKVQ